MAERVASLVTRLFHPSNKLKYAPLQEREPFDNDNGHAGRSFHQKTSPGPAPSGSADRVRLVPFRHVLLYGVPVVSFLVGFFWPHNLDRICFYHTSMRSPIAADMDISYHQEEFDNAFMKPTIYRMDPSPAVDAAWDDLGFTWENATFTPQQWADAEMPPDAVRVPEDHGPNYFGEIKAFHDLHCLNLLRKALYFNIDYYKSTPDVWEFQDDDQVIKTHVGHCLDSLRLQLTCTPSLDVLPWVWVDSRAWIREREREPSIIANFKTGHMCRDFGAIRDWYRRQQDVRLKSGELGPWRPRSDDVIHDGDEFP